MLPPLILRPTSFNPVIAVHTSCVISISTPFTSSASSSSSIHSENYSQLLNAFKETHEETNKLALSNIRLRGLNN